jgi:hypothetical protein
LTSIGDGNVERLDKDVSDGQGLAVGPEAFDVDCDGFADVRCGVVER